MINIHKSIHLIIATMFVLTFPNVSFGQDELHQSVYHTSTSQISQIFDVLGDFRNNTVFSCVNGFDFTRIAQEKGGTVHSQTFEDFILDPLKLMSGKTMYNKMYFINTFHLLDKPSDVLEKIKKNWKVSGECYFIQKNDKTLQNSSGATEEIVSLLMKHHFHYITVDNSSIEGYSLIRIDNYAPPCNEH